MPDFFEKLGGKENLSKSDKKVLNCISKNRKKIETFTINQLAIKAKTSVASVQRFCQKLGYSGFKEFKFEISKNINLSNSKTDQDKFVFSYLNNVFQTIKNNLFTDSENICKLVKALRNDRPNIIIGTYYSTVPAKYLYFGLLDLGNFSAYASSVVDGEHLLNTSDQDSTIVLFSINGFIENYKNYWQTLLYNKRENSFLITLNKETKLKSYFAHTIVLPGKNLANGNVVDPQSIPILFVEILLNIMYEASYIKQ